MPELIILGAGIHGRILLDMCMDAGIAVRGFLEDGKNAGDRVLGVPIIGGFDETENAEFISAYDFIVGIGGSQDKRRYWCEILRARGGNLRTVAHPSSAISRFADVGEGCFIGQHTTIMHQATIGDFAIISCNSSIGDDCVVGENVFIAGGCQINGRVIVEEDAYVGSGAVISPGCRIGRRSVVGLNSTVTRDIPAETVCVGPAAKIVVRGTDHIMSHIDGSKSGARIISGISSE